MTIDDLRQIDNLYHSKVPQLFGVSPPDPVAEEVQIAAVEATLGVRLPQRYRDFLLAFGGGHFGLTVVFSASPTSEWYLPTKERAASEHLPPGRLAFSDDFAGGYYVFRVVDGQAQERVWYWNDDGGETPTEFADVLEFIARYAYEPA